MLHSRKSVHSSHTSQPTEIPGNSTNTLSQTNTLDAKTIGFNFTILPIKDKSNKVADALSRSSRLRRDIYDDYPKELLLGSYTGLSIII